MYHLLTTQHVPAGVPSVFGPLSTEEEIKQVLVNMLSRVCMVIMGVVMQRWYWATIIRDVIEPHEGLVLGHIRQPKAIHCRPEEQQVTIMENSWPFEIFIVDCRGIVSVVFDFLKHLALHFDLVW